MSSPKINFDEFHKAMFYDDSPDDSTDDSTPNPKEPPKQSSKESPKEQEKSESEPVKETKTVKVKKPGKLAMKTRSPSESDKFVNFEKLSNEANAELEKLNKFVPEAYKNKTNRNTIYHANFQLEIPEPSVYEVDGNIYTVLDDKTKKELKKNIELIQTFLSSNKITTEIAPNNTTKYNNLQIQFNKKLKDPSVAEKFDKEPLQGLLSKISEAVDNFEHQEDVEKARKPDGEKRIKQFKDKPTKAHKDKAQMTVQQYIDELAQMDAFTVPEEKLREGLNNAIDTGIIGLDKKKIDSAVDAIYSKSLLFNKKLKNLLDSTPEEVLHEKIPPEVLARLNKLKGHKEDIKNRKYKLFKKPPNEPHTESPATIPPHERDYQPPYGLNPLLLRGMRVLTSQIV